MTPPKGEKAFTLVEVLFCLVIFMITTVLMLQSIFLIQKNAVPANGMNLQEWELFMLDLKNEMTQYPLVEVRSNKIFLAAGGDTVSFEKYGYSLRRRVNNAGHEVLLHNVQSYEVRKGESWITIRIVDRHNQEYNLELPFLSA